MLHTIQVTDEQLQVLELACQLYVKIGQGQISAVLTHLTDVCDSRSDLEFLFKTLRLHEPLITGKPIGSYPSLANSALIKPRFIEAAFLLKSIQEERVKSIEADTITIPAMT